MFEVKHLNYAKMVFPIVYSVLLLSTEFKISSASNENTLVSLHILFRHGERSPTATYKNDPHKNYSWPGGLDQLTNKGKLEMYELGLSFRKRYDSFLSSVYFPDDVYVQSSYADRCHMSAQLLLAALYPPKDEQIWNENFLWQPIPIHSVPRQMDNKIAIKRPCPTYKKELDNAFATDEKAFHSERKALYDYLSKHSGDSIQNLTKLESLFNTLEIESLNNLTLPNWTLQVFPDKMKNLAAMSLQTFTKTDFMKRMHGGVLLTEIVRNMYSKRQGNLKPNRKLLLYSGHDLTVVSLMRVLGFDELLKPEFGAAVILEQHNIDRVHIVKVFYQRNTKTDPEAKFVRDCGDPCLLDEFQQVLNKYIIDDWEKECKIH